MARPFKNSSSANKAFGVFSESQDAGEYIYNKKTKATYCSNTCSSSQKFGSESNMLLFKRSYKLGVYPFLNSINKADLNINLITKLDLSGNVPVIQDFSNNYVPTSITTNAIPYLDYNIDPCGNLFGNDICGINNWKKYLVYTSTSNCLISNTLTSNTSTGSTGTTVDPVLATGYSKFYSDPTTGYTGIVFEYGTSSQTITFNSQIDNVNVLVVGGGGGGGSNNNINAILGGGGGGGGIYYSTTFSPSIKTTYNITVGSGGLGCTSTSPNNNGENGGNSIISTSTGPLITSTGGYGSDGSNGGYGGDGGYGGEGITTKNGGNGGYGINSNNPQPSPYGNGKDSTIQIITLPFTQPNTILNLSGGGGGASVNFFDNYVGGNPGLGSGGSSGTTGGAPDGNGIPAVQSFQTGSGFGGGGGGCAFPTGQNFNAGNGGNGVVIFWWSN